MTDDQIIQTVNLRITSLQNMAVEHMAERIQFPVEYYDNKLAAGMACYRPLCMQLNMPMLRDNLEDMLYETVAHELAHLIIFSLWVPGTTRPKPHGAEWQDVMRRWFKVEPRRTHNYDTSTTKVKRQSKWEAACSCRIHAITTTKQMNIAMNKREYRCRNCKAIIQLTGKRA